MQCHAIAAKLGRILAESLQFVHRLTDASRLLPDKTAQLLRAVAQAMRIVNVDALGTTVHTVYHIIDAGSQRVNVLPVKRRDESGLQLIKHLMGHLVSPAFHFLDTLVIRLPLLRSDMLHTLSQNTGRLFQHIGQLLQQTEKLRLFRNKPIKKRILHNMLLFKLYFSSTSFSHA